MKRWVPIAAVAFLGATLWQYFLPDGLVIPTSRSAYGVEEQWSAATAAPPHAEPPRDRSAGNDSVLDFARVGRRTS